MNEIEDYLARNIENIDLIIEQVVFYLPESYFYKPEIQSGRFLELRQGMDEVTKKMKFWAYRGDRGLTQTLKKLQREYAVELKNLAIRKRRELQDELLLESLEMQCACMISLISTFKLLKHLRTFD
ncbi:hypothetical protein [Streptococcus oriscaviae]|uniref:Uncharacterized protein n=1 Tax=Streptococcus oriscaviae TaxID=2781599 RepID=A0ABX7YIM3_9STRE|nr:hypothetical protein [Streptococcus oriscaviae]QUE53558.1 hypothetical protein INT76_06750 [Streptococcus oriscaviae]